MKYHKSNFILYMRFCDIFDCEVIVVFPFLFLDFQIRRSFEVFRIFICFFALIIFDFLFILFPLTRFFWFILSSFFYIPFWLNFVLFHALFNKPDKKGKNFKDDGCNMMNKSQQINSKTDKLSQDNHVFGAWEVEYHEAYMKDKGIDGEDETVRSHLLPLEADHHP